MAPGVRGLSDSIDLEMEAMEELLRFTSAKSLVGVRDFIKAQEKEIERVKAELQFTRNEAISLIRDKNEEIARLKKGRKL